jgi:hypothetical protein
MLIITAKVYPQDNSFIFFTSDSINDFYPLQIGNRWDYSYYYTDYQGYSKTDSFTVAVTSDTMMPNGIQYFVLSRPDLAGGKFVRIDSNYIYYFDISDSTDVPFFKLDAAPGEGWSVKFGTTNHVWLDSVDTLDIFGFPCVVKHYKLDGLILGYVALADKFGLYSYNSPGEPPGSDNTTDALIAGIIDNKTYGTLVGIKRNNHPKLPKRFVLYQNYPNPFNPSTRISYQMSERGHVKLTIYDLLGKVLTILIDKEQPAGYHEEEFNASSLTSGIYFYRLDITNEGNSKIYSEFKKMMLLK